MVNNEPETVSNESDTSSEPSIWLTTTRIESLTDNVFAFAMTLLVINVKVSNIPGDMSISSVTVFLKDLWPHISGFIVSFIILAVFWSKHHKQFHMIERVDRIVLWINIVLMMFVVLVPFTTNLAAKYDGVQIAEITFDINLLIISVMLYINWIYASTNSKLISPQLDYKVVKSTADGNLIIPITCLVAIVFSFFHASMSSNIFIAIPFILYNYIK